MFEDINEPKWNPLHFAETHVLLQKVKLIGDGVDREYTVLTELAKRWFASLPILIEKLKKHGFSFNSPLTVSQLMVDKYGQFVLSNGTLLTKTNKRQVSMDYFSSAGVFKYIIRQSCKDAVLPYSFQDLLWRLRMKRTPHGYYISVHPAFLPISSLSEAYLDVYDHVKEKLSDAQARTIWPTLIPTSTIWNSIMECNLLLRAWFDDPYNQDRNREEERYIFGNGKHLFAYLRNVHSHLLAYVKLLGKDYTKDDARTLVDCKFSRVMPILYWNLWLEKILPDIESEVYFCKPGGACCPTPGFCLRRELRLTLKESQERKRLLLNQRTDSNQICSGQPRVED